MVFHEFFDFLPSSYGIFQRAAKGGRQTGVSHSHSLSVTFWKPFPRFRSLSGNFFFVFGLPFYLLASDILFPFRTPSQRPHPDPTQHPKTDLDPKRTETDQNQALWGGRGCRDRGGGGVVP